MSKIILTGDRPTGKLHLGHFASSLRLRLKYQEEGDYDEMYVFSADMQGLTDNAKNPEKIKENVFEVIKDNLSIGLDPKKITFFVQSGVPELNELLYLLKNNSLPRERSKRYLISFVMGLGYEKSF